MKTIDDLAVKFREAIADSTAPTSAGSLASWRIYMTPDSLLILVIAVILEITTSRFLSDGA